MQPNDARQGQGHRLPKDSVCPSPSNVLRLIFHSAGAEAFNTAASPRRQLQPSALFLLPSSLFAARLSFSARARYLQVFNNSFQYDTNSINSVLILTQSVNTHLDRCQIGSAPRAQHQAAHTRANSLLVVELRGDCGWTAWSAHRQDEEPCTLLRSCTTHALAPHVLRAGSGPRAPLLLRESTRIKGDKAGIRKQRPHATVASPPSVRPRHVRRTS